MLPLQKKLESQPRSRGRCGFQVMKGEKYYAIQFSDGVDFGMVNAQTARALDNVVSQPSVYLEAFALAEQCQRVLRRARKPSEATLTVDIYVCGSIDAKQIVGDRLSAAKVYLQHIEHHAEKYHYDNPHYISFPGIDADAIPETTFNSSHPGRVPAAQKVRNIFAQVCDSLQRDRSLQTVEKDIRIRTALLK